MPPRPRPEPCSSSSLGKDSDEGAPPGEDGEREVQSAYSAAGLDGGLGALEESLPIRRGISKFYNGKSRSYTILKEAIGPSGSAKVIAKADNAYSRKRKNLLAYSIMYDQSQITVPESETYENRISKRFASLSRLRPSDGMSSNSSSSSSLSSDEIELPQQFNFVQSPDNVAHFASPTITTPLCGSCAPKILPMPSRSFSMVNMHRFHSGCSIICLKEEPEAD